ncbi:hypothetical protein [Roseateles violae]|uniref:Uncharacterized protein n=1 Tax=Roseateles violae TaxID=3058042 RepID=A0ABT8DLP3_9BURK|nr:hypothetical protein [Pelomonas sp. PFR6]MDN3919332.1 hypothetical protein [Pelomonas sp. PFR6]
MSVATQTFGLPLSRRGSKGSYFSVTGARVWSLLIASIKARMAAAAERRAERELLELAAQYDQSMPSFAAELRAANCRR